MRLLILGGTVFLGRHVAGAALERGHQVTLFHRGRSNPGVWPAAEHVIGDRDGGLDALGGRTWDAVVDTSGYVPRLVRAAARRLSGVVGHYVFVSSVSAYAEITRPLADESHPLAALVDPTVETVTGETYGGLKAACERAAEEEMPGRVASIRAGLLVGPHDTSDRFPYWPRRIARGGETLAPAPREHPTQFVDARDLAEWMVGVAQQ
ncbi:MAG: NAD-dependent epimerase/dehydratase family protein, partial [Candidatus Eisenbacteria bacterium]